MANYVPNSYKNRLSKRQTSVSIIQDQADKSHRMLEAFFDPTDNSVRSIRECYIAITGDKRVTGKLVDCDASRFTEALDSSSFSAILGDAITRQLLRDYAAEDIYSVWRHLVKIENIKDFRSQERTRYGGYGNLQSVAENGAYPALTSPDDEKASYALTKRGGTESITLEMIANDDVGVVQRVPKKLAQAAHTTLAEFVLDFLKDNPVIYDGDNLFSVAHGNLGADPLSAASLAEGRVAMRSQREPGSNAVIGATPRKLLVPFALEETAYNLFRRTTNNDRTFTQSHSLDIIPVYCWTDTDDWCLSADPAQLPCVEIGFFNGNEEPEIFVQDVPSQGSLFTKDQITYKIRHIYGGNVIDYRGLYKGVVV